MHNIYFLQCYNVNSKSGLKSAGGELVSCSLGAGSQQSPVLCLATKT